MTHLHHLPVFISQDLFSDCEYDLGGGGGGWRRERDTFLAMGTGQNHISSLPSQRHFSAVFTICSDVLFHKGGRHFSSSIWYMLSSTVEEVATTGVTFCV